MTLIDGEKVLFEAETGDLFFTTHRVRHGREEGDFTSIMLEEISSVAVTRHGHRWMAVLGWIVLLVSVVWAVTLGIRTISAETLAAYRGYESSAWGVFVVGAVLSCAFFVAYFVTRYSVVIVASAGASIWWEVERRGAEYVAGFVDQLEEAKNRRFMLRAQTPEVKPDNQVTTSGSTARAGAE